MLGDLGFPYYLGGSRYMAERCAESAYKVHIIETTDWDFYATWAKEREELLLQKGFTINQNAQEYRDSEAIVVLEKGNIDFILRMNAEFYHSIFENIIPEFYYKFLWKSSPYQPQRKDIVLCMEQLLSIRRL